MPIDIDDDDSDDSDDFAPDTTTEHVDSSSSSSGQNNSSTRRNKPPIDSDADYVTPAEESAESRDWIPKLDFSQPYVMIARSRSGEYYTTKGNGILIENSSDWERLGSVLEDNDDLSRAGDAYQSIPKDHIIWEKDLRPVAIWGSKQR